MDTYQGGVLVRNCIVTEKGGGGGRVDRIDDLTVQKRI